MKERLKNFRFMEHRKIYYIVCVVLIVGSIGAGLLRGYNLGIDFTGGTMIEMEMGQQIEMSEIEAVKAIAISVILMLIYVAIRFQWRYGLAAILALANTLLIVFGFYGLFHITINSPFIAAMLTILGYGINDTIVIFDRIRENTKDSSRRSVSGLIPLVDESIRQTVGRSIMTSLTTVIVMVPLLIICGSTIRSFILPLLVGVIASTLSSIFVATSLWYDINRLTRKGSYSGKSAKKKESKKQVKGPAV